MLSIEDEKTYSYCDSHLVYMDCRVMHALIQQVITATLSGVVNVYLQAVETSILVPYLQGVDIKILEVLEVLNAPMYRPCRACVGQS